MEYRRIPADRPFTNIIYLCVYNLRVSDEKKKKTQYRGITTASFTIKLITEGSNRGRKG